MFKKILITAAVAIVMAGCVSTQKQRSRAEQFYREHPEELAEKCATNFPPTYKEGKTITLPGDTVFIKGDSVKCPDVVNPVTGEKKPGVKIKCPDSKTIYIPTLRVDTVESTALLARVEQQRQQLADKSAKLKQTEQNLSDALKTAKNRSWAIIALAGAIGLYAALKVWSKIKLP